MGWYGEPRNIETERQLLTEERQLREAKEKAKAQLILMVQSCAFQPEYATAWAARPCSSFFALQKVL